MRQSSPKRFPGGFVNLHLRPALLPPHREIPQPALRARIPRRQPGRHSRSRRLTDQFGIRAESQQAKPHQPRREVSRIVIQHAVPQRPLRFGILQIQRALKRSHIDREHHVVDGRLAQLQRGERLFGQSPQLVRIGVLERPPHCMAERKQPQFDSGCRSTNRTYLFLRGVRNSAFSFGA